ncbi:MAG TPA: NCS1 family nucleobase:cation symporter-1 [Pyrinomonadaceae bacterium]
MAANSETIQYPDGRVELKPEAFAEIIASPLFNRDLAPVKVSDRNWTTYNYAALWISMAHCIPTYMLSSGLISAGMNWWQALITILLGNTIVLVPILLNSHPGTKYGIPFPVFARASYGTYGSNLPALMRAIVACGWFGIQAWIGGEALNTLFAAIIPNWNGLLGGPIGGHMTTEWISFLLFWSMNIYIIYRGMDLLRKVENWAAPFVLVMTALLLAWAIWKAHGLGFLLREPGQFHSWAQFRPVFFLKLTAMIGFWATLSLNMPDFTRFGHSQKEQAVGQVVALPTTMTIFAAMSVMITSAAMVIYHDLPQEQIDGLWDPMKLVSHFPQFWIVAISMFTVVVATVAVNIAANVVSPANDFANAFPRWISFGLGGLITGIIGILMQPWRLLKNPDRYINGWLVGYSGGMGAIAGVLIVDYWMVRKKRLVLGDLYRTSGAYTYNGGWNWRAVVATLLGCFFAWIGVFIRALRPLYDYAWFVGFGVSASAYLLLMKMSAPKTPAVAEAAT